MAGGRALRALGRGVIAPFGHTAATFALLLSALRRGGALANWPVRQVFYRQVYFTGIQALPRTSTIGLFLGVAVLTQVASLVGKNAALGGQILVWVVVRELGPFLAAFVVIARSCSAVAAELGSMQVHRELDHLRAMGIDPVRYLVVPRVAGMAVSLLCVTSFLGAVTVVGGLTVSSLVVGLPFLAQMWNIVEALRLYDLGVSGAKCVLFGLIIGASACHQGTRVRGSVTEVPQATTRAVMQSLTLVTLANALITLAAFV